MTRPKGTKYTKNEQEPIRATRKNEDSREFVGGEGADFGKDCAARDGIRERRRVQAGSFELKSKSKTAASRVTEFMNGPLPSLIFLVTVDFPCHAWCNHKQA